MTQSEEIIAKGVTWLDENYPNWESKIDLDRLKMSNSCRCILGQLFINFSDFFIGRNLPSSWAEEHGFDASKNTLDYSELQDKWTSEIIKRREITCK